MKAKKRNATIFLAAATPNSSGLAVLENDTGEIELSIVATIQKTADSSSYIYVFVCQLFYNFINIYFKK